MTSSLWLRDLLAFVAQTTILAAAGAAATRVLRIDRPSAALAYWRTLLVVCLLLPFVQPWRAVAPSAPSAVPPLAIERVTRDVPIDAPRPTPSPWTLADIALAIVAAGIAARALWLAGAASNLRRLRQAAAPLAPLPPAIEAAQTRLGIRAAMYVSDRIAGPITFGAIRPRVLFPPRVIAMDAPILEAIACHELLHVRRRDWLTGLGEEAVRTICWFHPAIWWLIGRIQLTREQVVDREVIALTSARDCYVDALLSVALTHSSHTLAPAPLFLRRGLLKRRIARILEEHTMSTRRLIASLAASVAALALAATVAVRLFPIHAHAQSQPASDRAVTIVSGGDYLLHGEIAEYPRRAIENSIAGDVVVQAAVDEGGEVSDAAVVSGPIELRKAALESVLQWHYAPSARRSTTVQVTLRFNLEAARAMAAREKEEPRSSERGFAVTTLSEAERQFTELERALKAPQLSRQEQAELRTKLELSQGQLEELRKAFKEQAPVEGPQVLAQIKNDGLTDATLREIIQRANVHVGDAWTEDAARRVRAVAAAVDEHIRVEFARTERGIMLVLIAP